MIVKYLWMAGCLPYIILGTIHLLYTFFTNKFSSRNRSLNDEMKTSFPILTDEISMWNAWIGFNGSHSSGIIYIGLVNLFVTLLYPFFLQSAAFLSFNIITALFYLWLAKKYWFRIPLIGTAITAGCFIAAAVVMAFN